MNEWTRFGLVSIATLGIAALSIGAFRLWWNRRERRHHCRSQWLYDATLKERGPAAARKIQIELSMKGIEVNAQGAENQSGEFQE